MKKLNLTRFLSFLLVVALILNVFSFLGFIETDYAFADNYYSSITATSGTKLLGQLHDLITTTHQTYTSYGDCKNESYIVKTDGGSSSSYVMEFYSHSDISATWQNGRTWNREHVWCQSLSNSLWGESGGGSDLHHIRPAENRLNSTRSNNKYGEVENGKEAWCKDTSGNEVALGGYIGGGVFEPLDNVKGDVARIVMYVYTHYNTYSNVYGTTNGSGKDSFFGTLKFTNIVDANSEAEAIALLLKWNKDDPVDYIERERNDAVYEIQGNRNPFIDNENYANLIWSDSAVVPDLDDLTITPDEIELSVGQSKKLTVTASPVGADSRVTWSSEDETVATVKNGTVTAVGEGATIITATSVSNPEIDVLALVTVTKASYPVGGEVKYITIDTGSFNLTTGYNFKEWSSGGVGGFAFIYYNNNGSEYDSTGLQFNVSKDSYYLASNTAMPGPIVSVTAKIYQGKNDKKWKLLTSDTAYTQVKGKPTNGNDWGTQTVTQEGVTWDVTGTDTYFALTYEESKSACYLDSIIVGYIDPNESSGGDIGGGDDPEPTVESIECDPASVTLDEGEATLDDLREKLTVKEVYSDGSKVEIDDYVINGFDSTVFTEQTVTISFGDNSTTVSVKINQKSDPTPPVPDNTLIEKFTNAVSLIVTDGTPYQRYESLNKAITAYNALSNEQKEDDEVKSSLSTLQSALSAYNAVVSDINESSRTNTENAVGASGVFLLVATALLELIKKLL